MKKGTGVPIKTGGSKPGPTGDHGDVGKAGNQNEPKVQVVGVCPKDANKFDENFRHRIKE